MYDSCVAVLLFLEFALTDDLVITLILTLSHRHDIGIKDLAQITVENEMIALYVEIVFEVLRNAEDCISFC